MENLDRLIIELCKLPNETEWVEFKHNNYDPYMIGRDISALANSAALKDKSCGYMLWGIDNATHEIIGTDYNLQSLKKGDQEIGNWLRYLLSKNVDFEFHTVHINDKDVGILIINRAANQTVTFEKIDYIRIGSYTKKLNEFPAIQIQLWDKIRNTRFEEQFAKTDLNLERALHLLDYTTYFDIISIPQPTDAHGIVHYLQEEAIIIKQDNGLYSITNLGAILFAKRLVDFPRISRKAIRVVQYSGNNRLNMLKEDIGTKGYAVGFEGLIKYIEALIPTQEYINGALREKKSAYPILAIREAVANALIHQDFSIPGTGPTVEVFENRIEITNSGRPLVDIQRIIDNPPKSRNEKLASLMRRLKMCEEL
ncbi:MAG: putative DNA binding domain-containing protein [Eubacteriales bacterium]|nr:putative DNA binding domain-containing protein [Eubacteriales bacterium]